MRPCVRASPIFDSARAYAGIEGYYGAYYPYHRDAWARVFRTTKSASCGCDGAVNDLKTTMRTMGTDRLDLWQIHDVRNEEDIDAIECERGALEAFIAAKEEGLSRFIGITKS